MVADSVCDPDRGVVFDRKRSITRTETSDRIDRAARTSLTKDQHPTPQDRTPATAPVPARRLRIIRRDDGSSPRSTLPHGWASAYARGVMAPNGDVSPPMGAAGN